jgi:hypothetical protein
VVKDEALKPIVQADEGMKTISAKLEELMEFGALPVVKQIIQQPKPEKENQRNNL